MNVSTIMILCFCLNIISLPAIFCVFGFLRLFLPIFRILAVLPVLPVLPVLSCLACRVGVRPPIDLQDEEREGGEAGPERDERQPEENLAELGESAQQARH